MAFSEQNPIVTTVYFLSVTVIAMFSMNPVIAVLALAGGIIYHISMTDKNGGHAWYLIMLVLSTVLNPIFNHSGTTVLFLVNDRPITLEAVLFGILSGCAISSALYWFGAFTRIMTSDRLLYVFGFLSPNAALVLSMALRYAPLLRERSEKVTRACRGIGVCGEDNLPDRLRSRMRVFSIMTTWAIENGIITADSMTSRGFGCTRRTGFRIFRFGRQDAISLALIVILTGATVCGAASGALDYAIYPTAGAVPHTGMAVISYIAYGILVLLPTAVNLWEALLWKFYRSGI